MGYVLITGGNFKNKGAQAMIFITVDEIRKRFPNKEIIVVSDADAVDEKKKVMGRKQSNFQFLLRDYVCIYGWKYKLVQHRYGKLDVNKDASKIRKQIEMIIDISGYTFGSNFGWMSSFLAAYRAKKAKDNKVPIYYMPQSFGPFDWEDILGKITKRFITKWLSYAKILFAREEEGYKLLKSKLGLSNVKLSDDLVLQNTGINLKNIYYNVPQANIPKIELRSVAILPNIRNYEYGNFLQLMHTYKIIIDVQLSIGRTIYLIRHATEDIDFCRKIKALYKDEKKVVFLENDFNCFEFGELVKQFDYLVASRYHAVVQAYKQGVPCLVLGWAVKYEELMKKVSQEDYAIDVRDNIDSETINKLIDCMENNWKKESEKIKKAILLIQQKNVFDNIEEG